MTFTVIKDKTVLYFLMGTGALKDQVSRRTWLDSLETHHMPSSYQGPSHFKLNRKTQKTLFWTTII